MELNDSDELLLDDEDRLDDELDDSEEELLELLLLLDDEDDELEPDDVQFERSLDRDTMHTVETSARPVVPPSTRMCAPSSKSWPLVIVPFAADVPSETKVLSAARQMVPSPVVG